MNQLNQKEHSRAAFYSLLSLLLGLCFVRYALQIDLPRIILLVVAAAAVFAGDRDEIIAVCVCSIPLYTSYDYIYAVFFAIIVYAVKFGRHLRINLMIAPAVLLIVWELLHCFNQFSITAYVGGCMPLVLLALLMCGDGEGYDYDFIVRALSVSIAAMCVCLLGKLVYSANFNLVAAFANLQRLGLSDEEMQSTLTVTGGELNPNTLGIMCLLGITGLMQLRMAGRKKKGDAALTIFLLLFGTLTASRTYFVCLLLVLVLLLFSQKGSLSQKLKLAGRILILIVLAVVLLCLIFPGILTYFFSRFQVEDITTGRMDLLATYNNFILSNMEVLFFGVGHQHFSEQVLEVYRVSGSVPHNGMQELVIAWGLPGLLMFVALWVTMILRSRRMNGRQGLINYIPLIILLAKAQAGQMINSGYTMLAFSFAYLSMCAELLPEAEEN